MVFILFFLLSFFSLFSRPLRLIDRRNQAVDILYQVTGFEGPYTFTCLKGRNEEPFILKVDGHDKSYVVRFIEKFCTAARSDEIAFCRYASQHQCGPEVLYANEDNGVIVMEYFDEARNAVNHNDSAHIDLLVECVKKIHSSNLNCRQRDRFTEAEGINRFSYMLENNVYGIDLLSLQGSLKFLAQCIDWSIAPVFVHGDLHRWNIFFCGDSYKAIDFESGRYDHPYVDLARIAVCFGFSDDEERYLLERYWQRPITSHDWQQFTIFKVFNLANIALWMLETLPNDFIKAEGQNFVHVKPLSEFVKAPLMQESAVWRYRVAITMIKEAQKLLGQLQQNFAFESQL